MIIKLRRLRHRPVADGTGSRRCPVTAPNLSDARRSRKPVSRCRFAVFHGNGEIGFARGTYPRGIMKLKMAASRPWASLPAAFVTAHSVGPDFKGHPGRSASRPATTSSCAFSPRMRKPEDWPRIPPQRRALSGREACPSKSSMTGSSSMLRVMPVPSACRDAEPDRQCERPPPHSRRAAG